MLRLVLIVGAFLGACGDTAPPPVGKSEQVGSLSAKLDAACTAGAISAVSDHPIYANTWTSSAGSKVTFTTTWTGCTDPEFRVYHAPPGQGFVLWKDWGQVGSSFVWDTAGEIAGQHRISVWARAKGAPPQPEVSTTMNYVVLAAPSCSAVSTTTSPIPSFLAENYTMAAVGTAVTLSTNASGCAPAEYRIVSQQPGGSWVENAGWSATNSTYVWDTAGKAPGVYSFLVLARAQGSPAEYEWRTGFNYKLLPSPLCAAISVMPSPTHPGAANGWMMGPRGTEITFTTATSPCADGEYQVYHLRPNTGTWQIDADYPAAATTDPIARNATFHWVTTSETPGIHQFQIRARGSQHNVGYESYYGFNYLLLNSPMCDGAPTTFSPAGRAPVGALVNVLAAATGCPNPSFRFTLLPPGAPWRAPQEWTTHPVLHWNTLLEPPGSYSFNIWDRNVDSTAYYESYNGIYYTLDPVTPTHAVSVTGGAAHNCVLLASGQVGCWGANAHGELGNATTTSSSTPVATAGLIQGISLGVGAAHSCAVQYGGGVACWGQNDQNQVGNGVSQFATVPFAVTGLAGSAATVGVGAYHSCAALVDGTVQCWGSNSAGQLGDGTVGNTRAAPVTVAGLPNDAATGGAIQVAGGLAHTCALLGDATVRCWGMNDRGQLGNGGSSNSVSPVAVSGLTGVKSLSARGNATCAVRGDGTVWCWGDPTPYGVLGTGAVAPNYQRTPVQVAGVAAARNVALGAEHACVSLQNNTATCWGRNDQGQLGNGTTTNSLVPVAVTGLTNVASVGVGSSSSCALLEGHTTKCWGAGTSGELGNGASASSTTPVTVAPVPPWTACTGLSVAASPASTLATVGDAVTLTSTATGCATAEYEVYRQNANQTWTRLTPAYSTANGTFVWNTAGVTAGWQHLRFVARAPGSTQAFQAEQLFDYYLQSPDACNSLTITPSPASFAGTVGSLVTFTNTSTGCIGAPEYSIRHRRPDGSWHDDVGYSSANSTWVWDASLEVAGWNQFEVMVRSQNSTRTQEEVAYLDYYLQPGAPRVGGGFWQFCQLQGTGSVSCWGLNSHGELGAGSSAFHSATPLAVPGVNYGVSLGVGWAHACTTVLGGGVQCWGQNQSNQLGNGSQVDSNVPVPVAGVTTALHVAAGTAHSCAALLDGSVRCWGLNTVGQLGNGAPNAFSPPVAVANITTAKRVSAGYYHSCALLKDGTVRCWGKNDQGQLGNGTHVDSLTPVTVSGLTNVTQIATTAHQNCAVKADHTIWCWGASSPNGTLGDGTTTPHSTPVQVTGITNAAQVAVTGYHACAALQDGTVKCWGRNEHGELGDGTTMPSLSPVLVSGLSGAHTIAVSENASCAGLANGGVSCWGWGIEGNLGNGNYGNSTTPVSVGPTVPAGGGGGTGTCQNGVRDGDESDIDCGGSCSPCTRGGGCSADADCGSGLVCGTGNGGCFNAPRTKRVCWAAECADGVNGACGQPDSPCGTNCACATGCDADAASICPSGEVCARDAGKLFQSTSRDVCLDARCPSNDPSLCGGPQSICGACVCSPDCSQATCANPSDGCGGECPGVCTQGQSGCTTDLHCGAGNSCLTNPDGSRACRPEQCANSVLVPPLCGTPTAPCGEQCPVCVPACDGRECGSDPVCGVTCGAGTCSEGNYCDGDGHCVAMHWRSPPTVGGDDGSAPTTVPPLPPPPEPPQNVTRVGAVKGAFSVSQVGTPEFTIPIEVPPGRAGLEPALSLHYGGSRADGDLGIGWTLEGLSKITRCPHTFALDGYAGPITNTAADALCIDGKRLWQVAGPAVPDGTTPQEYRTVIDSFAKVVAYQEPGWGVQLPLIANVQMLARAVQGPDYFKVWTKDGRILTYGGQLTSLIISRNGARNAWLLTKVEDRAGNNILIDYDNGASRLAPDGGLSLIRPKTIRYTGHGSNAGNREVQFTYQPRVDTSVRYFQGGVGFAVQERLSEIRTYAPLPASVDGAPRPPQLVKTYRLDYDADQVSQIKAVHECGADGGCKAPTRFTYKSDTGFIPGTTYMSVQGAVQLDVDGNGIPDFLETTAYVNGVEARPEYRAAEFAADLAIGVATSFMSFGAGLAVTGGYAVVKFVALGLLADSPSITYKSNMLLGNRERSLDSPPRWVGGVTGLPCSPGSQLVFFDYDGDKRDDAIGVCNNKVYVSLSDGTGHFQPVSGDSPVLTLPVNQGTPAGSTILVHGAPPVFIDMNGDSLEDIVSCVNMSYLEVRFREGRGAHGFSDPLELAASDYCSKARPTVLPFDIDGDGATDLLWGGKTWKVLRYERMPSSGAQGSLKWSDVDFPNWNQSEQGKGLALADLNGDGLLDVWSGAKDKPDATAIWLNAGGRKFEQKILARPRPTDLHPDSKLKAAAALDYDGDGRLEILNNYEAYTGSLIGTQLFDRETWAQHFKNNFSEVELRPTTTFMFQDGNVMRQMPLGLITDLDGDGNVDVTSTNGTVYFGRGMHNQLLRRVVDGLGNFVDVEYDYRGGSPAYTTDCSDSGWPETCLKSMHGLVGVQRNGHVDSLGQDVTEATTEYGYRNARMSATGHGWLGFDSRSVTVTYAGIGTKRVDTTYTPLERFSLSGAKLRDLTPPFIYPFAGIPRTVVVHETPGISAIESSAEGAGFERRTRTTSEWELGISAASLPFPRLQYEMVTIYDKPVPPVVIGEPAPDTDDGTPLLTCVRALLRGDSYGNATEEQHYCDTGAGGVDDKTMEIGSTSTVYEPNPNLWLIANPKSVTTTSHRGWSAYMRTVSFEYDAAGLLWKVTRGTDEEGGDPTTYRQTTYVRNAYGNPEHIWQDVVTGEPRRTTDITYDVDQVYPSTITKYANGKQLTTQVDFDPRWGRVTSTVDPNGIIEKSVYDNLGLLSSSSDPGGTTDYAYRMLPVARLGTPIPGQYAYPRIEVSRTRKGTAGSAGGYVITELDYAGRAVRTLEQGLEQTVLASERTYDSKGRLTGSTLPHVRTSQAPTTLYTYDGLDRLTSLQRSDGSTVRHEYADAVTLAESNRRWLSELRTEGIDAARSALALPVGIKLTVDETGRKDVVVTDHTGRPLRNVDAENVDGGSGGDPGADPDALRRYTDFYYGGFNTLEFVVDSVDGAITYDQVAYNREGRFHWREDRNLTSVLAEYNGFDEVTYTRDAKGQERHYVYDELGRLRSIQDALGESSWTYDEGVNALGRLSGTTSPATAENPLGQSQSYVYEPRPADPLLNRGALKRIDHVIDGVTYSMSFDYDDLARPKKVHYPALSGAPRPPIEAEYGYDPSGALTRVDEVGTGVRTLLWQMTHSFEGQFVKDEAFGNGALTTYGYDPQRYSLSNITTTLGTVPGGTTPLTIQNLGYGRYSDGRVSARTDATTPGSTRTLEYTYDLLNRLDTITEKVNGTTTLTTHHAYDPLGNITERGAVTTTYDPERPHLIQTVGGNAYGYDYNGNVSSRSGPDVPGGAQTFDYTYFDMPRSVTTGAEVTTIDYNADEERVALRQPSVTRHYVGDYYQRSIEPGTDTTIEERFRLYAGSRNIGEIVRSGGSQQTLFFHSDDLGSADTITTDDGSVTRQAFQAFGAPTSPLTQTRTGFTSHQHDEDLGLIDMRGRVYDPLAARFLTKDPVRAAPYWSQGQNPYSYVFNDPINITDPSGFLPDNWDSTAAIEGWGVGVTTIAAGVAGSFGPIGLAANLGTSFGLDMLSGPFAAQAARSKSVTIGGHTSSVKGGGVGGGNATGANNGIVGPPQAKGQEGGAVPGAKWLRGPAPYHDPTGLKAGPNLAQTPGLPSDTYKLSPGAQNALRPFFKRWGLDVNDIILHGQPLQGAQAYTTGDFVHLNPDVWNGLTPKQQRELLAHEITHSVQYRKIGWFDFIVRYFKEYPRYGVPSNLGAIPLNNLDVVDSRFSLDQIADRVELEYHNTGP